MDAALVGFQRLLARGALDPALFHPALAAPLALLTTDASLRAPALVAALDKLSQAGVVLRRRPPKARVSPLPCRFQAQPHAALGLPTICRLLLPLTLLLRPEPQECVESWAKVSLSPAMSHNKGLMLGRGISLT